MVEKYLKRSFLVIHTSFSHIHPFHSIVLVLCQSLREIPKDETLVSTTAKMDFFSEQSNYLLSLFDSCLQTLDVYPPHFPGVYHHPLESKIQDIRVFSGIFCGCWTKRKMIIAIFSFSHEMNFSHTILRFCEDGKIDAI